MMRIETRAIERIFVADGRRHIDWGNVAALAESMQERGLQQPLGIKPDGTLIWGNHRFEAAKRLGWRKIECNVLAVDDIDAGLMEIDENLIHAELTTADRVIALARRKELYEARHPETRWGGSSNSGPKRELSPISEDLTRPPSFVEDTAAKTRVSRKKVERDVRIGKAFTQEELEKMGKAKIPIHGMDRLAAARKVDPESVSAVLEAPPETLRSAAESLTGPFEAAKIEGRTTDTKRRQRTIADQTPQQRQAYEEAGQMFEVDRLIDRINRLTFVSCFSKLLTHVTKKLEEATNAA